MADEQKVDIPTTEDVEAEKAGHRMARDEAVKIPARYCDAFWVTSWPGHVRMSFGEYFERPYYHTTIVMTADDAEELSKIVSRIVQDLKENSSKPSG